VSISNLEIQHLVQDLKSKEIAAKIKAQRELFKKGISQVDYLISLLPNESAEVQCVICQVLGLSKNEKALEPLAKLFEHENPTLRCFAAGALGRLGDHRALIPLSLALTEELEEDPSVRAEAASALGKLGNIKAVEPLINSLINDKDKEVRSKAALALGLLGDCRAVEPLIDKIGYDFYVQRNAAIALGNLKDERGIAPLVKLLSDKILGEIAYYSLAKIDNAFLKMSKDEIMRKYKKLEDDETEKSSKDEEIVFDLDELLANMQDKNLDDEK